MMRFMRFYTDLYSVKHLYFVLCVSALVFVLFSVSDS